MTKEEVKIPLASYTFRVKECTKEISKSSGNAMLKVLSELVDEPLMLVDEEQVDVNGLEPKPKYVAPLGEKDSQGNITYTPKCLKVINEFRKSCSMELITLADLSSLEPAHFVGRKFVALASSKSEPMVDRETKKEVINKLTGKPILSTSFEIGRVLTAE